MPDYRRFFVAGGTYFFTVVTYRRRRLFEHRKPRQILGATIRECRAMWPFAVDALVLLPDHLHAIWSLPSGDSNYPARWSFIKKTFTQNYLADGGHDRRVSDGRHLERRRGIWQPRYWEHTIEDEDDFMRHLDYTHYNPVKHGLVSCPADWGPSTFHRWVKAGVYPPDWACGDHPPPRFPLSCNEYGEPVLDE